MKVFISWSGEVSKKVGAAFSEWLPQVSHSIETFFSEDDISKGVRWSQKLSKELESTAVGLFCVTRENLDSRWLNFEAGAISTALGDTPERPRVMPFLFGLRKADVQLPLSDFQMTSNDREDIWKMVSSINAASGSEELKESRLQKSFERWWPDLEDDLARLSEEVESVGPIELPYQPATLENMVEELLESSRDNSKTLASIDSHLKTGRQRSTIALSRSSAVDLANSWDKFTDGVFAVNKGNSDLPDQFRMAIFDLSNVIDSILGPTSIEEYTLTRDSHIHTVHNLVEDLLPRESSSIGDVPWDDSEPPF